MKLTRCKLSKKVQLRLLEFFTAEVTARTAADLLGIQSNTAALFYHEIRLVIEYYLSLEADDVFDGEVELDESYFGSVRKGKRGRGAADKTAVFGVLKRNGKVYTIVIADTKQTTLILESIILKSLDKVVITSMALKASGTNLNVFLENKTELIRKISTCF